MSQLRYTSDTSSSYWFCTRLNSSSSQLGCQQTFSLPITLKLNSCSLVFLNSFPKFLILLFLCPPMSITLANSARNLGVIFDSSLTFSEHILSVSKSCFLSICDLRQIWNTLDYSIAQTIATSLIHSKVDYCNSLFLNLPRCQLDRLQLNLNSAALAVSKPLASAISQIFTLAQNLPTHPVQSSLCYTAYYCSILSENKPPSSFHSYLVGFYSGTLNLLTHLRYYYLLSSHHM